MACMIVHVKLRCQNTY